MKSLKMSNGTKAANGKHVLNILNMCSHGVLLLGKSDVPHKKMFLLSPLQLKMCSKKKIFENL